MKSLPPSSSNPHDFFEVWWPVKGQDSLRLQASFRLLRDARRHAVDSGQKEVAVIRTPDGKELRVAAARRAD